jgi:acyl-CoA synthetase (AMP-forming)/AMP-acid ligase II
LAYPITIGVPVVVLPKFIDTLFFSSIQKYKITYAFLVPPIILHLANNPLADKFDLSSLQNVMSGAAPLGAGLTKKVKQRFPKISVSQGYGKIVSRFSVSTALISFF